MKRNVILQGDVLSRLKELPDQSVHCVVTSPPYWNLRNYGVAGQLGLETTPGQYIQKMVEVFRGVWRVLRDDGTLWLNIGDSYATTGKDRIVEGLKPKDMVGIPWMLAFALRADGWYLRSDIIWSKPNCMPESVNDRPTKSHEYIFLLTKQERYFYDAHAIKTPAKESSVQRLSQDLAGQIGSAREPGKTNGNMKAVGGGQANIRVARDKQRGHGRRHEGFNDRWDTMSKEEQSSMGANKRSVWTVSPAPFKEAHFATFPQDLIVDCIKAGTSEHGCCSRCGSPYRRLVVPSDRYAAILGESYHDHAHPEQGGMQTRGTNKQNKMRDAGIAAPEFLNKGWEPTCECVQVNRRIKSCIVLDPFMGAGTTALVARKLNRDYLGVELNPQYIKIATARLYKELGAFI